MPNIPSSLSDFLQILRESSGLQPLFQYQRCHRGSFIKHHGDHSHQSGASVEFRWVLPVLGDFLDYASVSNSKYPNSWLFGLRADDSPRLNNTWLLKQTRWEDVAMVFAFVST